MPPWGHRLERLVLSALVLQRVMRETRLSSGVPSALSRKEVEERIMAHECPICYETCHCNGDIDDCCMDGTQEQLYCIHCNEYDEDEDNYDTLDSDETLP